MIISSASPCKLRLTDKPIVHILALLILLTKAPLVLFCQYKSITDIWK